MENSYKENIDNLTNILDSSIASLSISKNQIENSITPEVLEGMTFNQKELMRKSKEFIKLGLDNPEELINKQQELVDLVSLAKEEENKNK